MIAEYEAEGRHSDIDAPREYALTQQHKHLKEMKAVAFRLLSERVTGRLCWEATEPGNRLF